MGKAQNMLARQKTSFSCASGRSLWCFLLDSTIVFSSCGFALAFCLCSQALSFSNLPKSATNQQKSVLYIRYREGFDWTEAMDYG